MGALPLQTPTHSSHTMPHGRDPPAPACYGLPEQLLAQSLTRPHSLGRPPLREAYKNLGCLSSLFIRTCSANVRKIII